jgi:uncharacterized membrane protein
MNLWSGLKPPSCYPDKCQCEAVRDEVIRMPSSFVSSFAYILAGIFIYRYVQKKSFELKLWAFVCVLMGLSSHLGHASFAKVFLAMDFASIVLVLSFFAMLNLMRMLKVSSSKMIGIFAVYYAFLYAAMSSMGKWGSIGMCLLIFFFSLGDMIREMGWSFLKARKLQLSLAVLTISFSMFIIDENHIGCDPYSWFQWHSMWHIGTALSMFFYGQWRFDDIRAR